jgi:hypothetical protein
MSRADRNLEIGHRASVIVKFQIRDFTILDFTISGAVMSGIMEGTP